MFGGAIKSILGLAFEEAPQGALVNPVVPLMEEEDDEKEDVRITGTQEQINAFAKTLAAEKNYMKKYAELGLNHSDTRDSKYILDDSVENFEKITDIKWPLK
jgi:hypothetical protein